MITAKQVAKQHGMLSVSEVELIHECMKRLKAEVPVVINIGAGTGTSTLAFLESSPNAYIFEIDPKDRPLAVKHRADYANQHRVAVIKGKSQGIGKNWPFLTDVIFVDGLHTNQAVREDCEVWLPTIKPGGIVFFHDYNHPNLPQLPSVVQPYVEGWPTLGQSRYLIAFRAPGE